MPQAALALVVVVGVPVLVGQVAKPEAESPKPTATSLTVNLERFETDEDMAHLRVITDGPAPTSPAVLTEDGGRHPVTVTEKPMSECSGLPLRRATSVEDGTEWCLALNGIDDGRKVSGAVASSGTTLTLTVNRREPIWPWPLLAALAGLLVGALVLLVPRWLSGQVRAALLNRLLDDNDAAGQEHKVDGLREWVATQREAGAKDDALLPVLSGVIARGPPAARRARHDLAEAVRVSSLSTSHPFVEAAIATAEKRGHSLDDFLKPDGTVRDVHPAREWLTALAQLERQDTQLAVAQQEMESTLTAGECRTKPGEALTAVRAVLSTLDSPKEVEAVEEKLEAAKQAIALAQERSECRVRDAFFVMGGGGGALSAPGAPPAEMLDLGPPACPSRRQRQPVYCRRSPASSYFSSLRGPCSPSCKASTNRSRRSERRPTTSP
jgi:hypothetical protein